MDKIKRKQKILKIIKIVGVLLAAFGSGGGLVGLLAASPEVMDLVTGLLMATVA